MALVDLKSDLKSLKFGSPPAYDRPGEGLSGQPYIKEPFIDSDIVPQSGDFLLRGGLNAPLDAATDVARLARYFADLKSPKGILFTAKENTLSRIGVRTQASGVGLNEGIYTPLSTLAQAGVGFSGGHLNKQGSNPFVGVTTYTDVKNIVIGAPNGDGNRLVDLYQTQIENFSTDPINIRSYSGGPNSQLGIGQTNIKFASFDQRTGINSGKNFQTYQIGLKYDRTDLTSPPLGVSNEWFEYTGLLDSVSLPDLTTNEGLTFKLNDQISVYNKGTLNSSNNSKILGIGAFNNRNFTTLTQEDIEGISIVRGEAQFFNFQNLILRGVESLDDKDPNKSSTIMSISPSYNMNNGKTMEGRDGSRIRITSPGLRGNRINYTKGKITNGKVSVVDRINFQPLYQSDKVGEDGTISYGFFNEVDKRDLVKFRIAAILRNGKKVFMHFRAFINNFSDNYGASWSGIKYMGRGEELFKYGGFSRKLSLSFTVAAQSKPELMAQYKKLNFLASTLAPDYGDSGYMGGVLTTLTMGGWCYELPGFISQVNLEVPQESPWEIAIDNEGNLDETVKEMPHICNVTMDFTPIHTFRPELQSNKYGPDKTSYGEGEISEYGEQRYLQLTNGNNNNYVPVSLANAQTPDFKQST